MEKNSIATGKLISPKDYAKVLIKGAIVEIARDYAPNTINKYVVESYSVGKYCWLATKDSELIELNSHLDVYLVEMAPIAPIAEPLLPGAIVLLNPRQGYFSYIIRIIGKQTSSFSPWRYPDNSPAIWGILQRDNRIHSVLSPGIVFPDNVPAKLYSEPIEED